MTLEEVKKKLIDTLHEIQRDSGLTEQVITDDTRPIDEIEGFDSLISLEATVMLSEKLNINIPNDVNIFFSEDRSNSMTINEITDVLYRIYKGSKK